MTEDAVFQPKIIDAYAKANLLNCQNMFNNLLLNIHIDDIIMAKSEKRYKYTINLI